MISSKLGASASDVEILNINAHGVWLYVNGAERFMPYDEYPWFRDAKVGDILEVRLLHEDHLDWPALDVDLSVKTLRNPDAYPLIYR